jgi:hypothetical protein
MLDLPVISAGAAPGADRPDRGGRFKGNRRSTSCADDETLRTGEYVVVEAERGQDLGRVEPWAGSRRGSASGCAADGRRTRSASSARGSRRAEPEEVQRARRAARRRGARAPQGARAGGAARAEDEGDRGGVAVGPNKLTLYFTAERRVDFRQLVRDLARTFRTRIELRRSACATRRRCSAASAAAAASSAAPPGCARSSRSRCSSPRTRTSRSTRADLRHLRPADVLPHLRARRLPAGAQALPARGQDGAHLAGAEKVIGIDIWRDQVTLLDESRQRRTVKLELREREMAAAAGARRRPSRARRRPRRPPPAGARRPTGAARATEAAAPPASPRRGGRRPDSGREVEPEPFYITTAIDYANGDPHLGHAFEKIGADAIARYRRLRGERRPLPDGDGRARAEGGADRRGPRARAPGARRRVADRSRRPGSGSSISHDQFIRTTDAAPQARRAGADRAHLRAQPGRLLRAAYEGWYCVGCELFKRENEIVDGRCVLHPTRELEWTEERNWFFRLSRYEDFLRERFAAAIPGSCSPESRRNEILALLDQGLEDISVTRARLEWAIPFPRPTSDGEPQGTWVWFDALPNYLTATGYPTRGSSALAGQLHVVGKDITGCTASSGRRCWSPPGCRCPSVWAHGFVYLRRRALQQVGRRAAGAGRGDRPLRARCVPLLPAARGAVGRATAASRGSASTSATRRSWRTTWATWPAAPSRWWPSTGAARCPA